VTTVQVLLHTSADLTTASNQCITVTNPSSLQDLQNQIRGKFNLAIPDNFLGIEVRAMTNVDPTFCTDGMDVAYGGETFTGQDQIDLRLHGVANCSALASMTEMKVRALDFTTLTSTPAGTPLECGPLAAEDAAQGLDLGMIRPTGILRGDIGFPSSVVSAVDFNTPVPMDEGGTGEVELFDVGEPMPTTCLASGQFFFRAASCIYPSNKQLCAKPGEIDVPVLYAESAAPSIDLSIWSELPVITFGIVVDATTKLPIAGAKVEIDSARGQVVYASLGGGKFNPIQSQVTDAGGLFLVYMKEPSVITVTEGASMKKMRVGGVTGWGSAVIVPLR
jgi:hypothetical protein